jgi:hypothetical protein
VFVPIDAPGEHAIAAIDFNIFPVASRSVSYHPSNTIIIAGIQRKDDLCRWEAG